MMKIIYKFTLWIIIESFKMFTKIKIFGGLLVYWVIIYTHVYLNHSGYKILSSNRKKNLLSNTIRQWGNFLLAPLLLVQLVF